MIVKLIGGPLHGQTWDKKWVGELVGDELVIPFGKLYARLHYRRDPGDPTNCTFLYVEPQPTPQPTSPRQLRSGEKPPSVV